VWSPPKSVAPGSSPAPDNPSSPSTTKRAVGDERRVDAHDLERGLHAGSTEMPADQLESRTIRISSAEISSESRAGA
jgi:hypothetical protein